MIDSKNFLNTYAPIIVIYTTLCGCLWQLGYWSTFKFNYLEYISISDVFKATVYPFISKMWYYLVLIVFPIGFTEWGKEFVLKQKFDQDDLIVESRGFRVFLHILILLSAIVAFIFSGLIMRSTNTIMLFPISTSVLVGCLIYKYGFLKKQINDYSLRFIILLGITLYPALNFAFAKQESAQAKIMFRYKKVDEVMAVDTTLNSWLPKLAYLGSSSEFHFFGRYETVYVVRQSEIKLMAISPFVDDTKWKVWLEHSERIF